MIRKTIGIQKRRYARGVEYAGVFLLLTVNAKLFEPTFAPFCLGFIWTFLLFASVYILLCWLAGYVDERWGIWKEENDHGWAVTPKADRLCQRVGRIAKRMDIHDPNGYKDLEHI